MVIPQILPYIRALSWNLANVSLGFFISILFTNMRPDIQDFQTFKRIYAKKNLHTNTANYVSWYIARCEQSIMICIVSGDYICHIVISLVSVLSQPMKWGRIAHESQTCRSLRVNSTTDWWWSHAYSMWNIAFVQCKLSAPLVGGFTLARARACFDLLVKYCH